jgi:hypothetical protein
MVSPASLRISHDRKIAPWLRPHRRERLQARGDMRHHRISSADACADEARRQRCTLAFLVTPDALRLRP